MCSRQINPEDKRRIEWIRRSVEWKSPTFLRSYTAVEASLFVQPSWIHPLAMSQTGLKYAKVFEFWVACSKDVQRIPSSLNVFFLFLSLCCRDNCSSCFFLIFTVGSCFQPRLSRMQLFDTPPGFDWSMKQMPPSLRKLHEGSSDLTQFHWYIWYHWPRFQSDAEYQLSITSISLLYTLNCKRTASYLRICVYSIVYIYQL